jgi:superfamily II DNA/RNA helicase
VQTWLAKAERKPTICFAVDRNHAKALQARFIEAGVRTGYMDCRTPLNERAELYEQFKSRAVEVVCNVDVIGVGIDWPEIEVISYARPTKSEIRFVQNIGRGLRISKGKERLLVLDHSDTHTRLGFAWQIVHDGLHGGRFAVSAPATVQLPRVCPKCKFVKGYSVVECPNCGFRTKPPPPPKEFTGAELAAFQGKAKRGKYDEKGRRQKEFTPAEKAIFYAELKGYAIMKGYKEGWAAHKFKERLEHWPVNKDVAPIMNMSPATGQWLRSRWIAESRSRANQAAESEVMRAIRAPVAPRNNAERNGLVPGTLCSEEDLEDFK